MTDKNTKSLLVYKKSQYVVQVSQTVSYRAHRHDICLPDSKGHDVINIVYLQQLLSSFYLLR